MFAFTLLIITSILFLLPLLFRMKGAAQLLMLVMFLCIFAPNAHAVSSEKKTLLSNSALATTTTSSWVCLPRQADNLVLYMKTINGAGSSPTLDVVVYDSDDQTNVHTLDTFTQATTGTATQWKPQNSASLHPLKCLRVIATLGGTASPAYNVDVKVFYQIRN